MCHPPPPNRRYRKEFNSASELVPRNLGRGLITCLCFLVVLKESKKDARQEGGRRWPLELGEGYVCPRHLRVVRAVWTLREQFLQCTPPPHTVEKTFVQEAATVRREETELGSYLPGFESLLHHLALCPGQVTHVPEPPFPHRWKRDVVIHLVTTGESRNLPDLGFLVFTTRGEGVHVEGPSGQADGKRHYHSRVRNGLFYCFTSNGALRSINMFQHG